MNRHKVEDVLGDESLEPQEDSDEDEGEADMGEEVSEETLQTLQQAGISLVNPVGFATVHWRPLVYYKGMDV